MTFQGQLEIDFNRGVIWFNAAEGCMLRICGLDTELIKHLAHSNLLDITLDGCDIHSARGEYLGVGAKISYGGPHE